MLKDIVEATPLEGHLPPPSLAYLISLGYLVFLCDKSTQPTLRRATPACPAVSRVSHRGPWTRAVGGLSSVR